MIKKLLLIFFVFCFSFSYAQEETILFNKYKKNPNFELLIFGREHNWDEVNKFKTNNKFTMPFYPDPERKIYSKFATQFIPRNFLISPEGKILFSSIGFEAKDFKMLKEMIVSQLKSGK